MEKFKYNESLFANKQTIQKLIELQRSCPYVSIGGSLSLALRGLDIGRKSINDIDVIIPNYEDFSELKTATSDIVVYKKSNGSGLNFKHEAQWQVGTNLDNHIKLDICISPKAPYERVIITEIPEFPGFEGGNFVFKLIPLEDVLDFKLQYSKKNPKHLNDIKKLIYK